MKYTDNNYVPIAVRFCKSVTDNCPNAALGCEFADELLAGVNMLAEKYTPVNSGHSTCRPHHAVFQISVSMCPNACSRPQIADIGIIAAVVPGITAEPCTGCSLCVHSCRENAITVTGGSVGILEHCLNCGICIKKCQSGTLTSVKKGFRVQLGGKLGRHPVLAEELPALYTVQETLELIDVSLQFYSNNRTRMSRFGDLILQHKFSWLPDRFLRMGENVNR